MNFPLFLAIWNRTQDWQTPPVHLRIAKWLEEAYREEGKRGYLLQAFRGCGKSTLMGLFCAYLLQDNPNLRILVLAADQPLATKMTETVKVICEVHPLCLHLKPQPPTQWAADRFTVERSAVSRDPSMLARGLYSNITGLRADIVICDDVEVPNTCATPSRRHDLRARLKEIEYILTPQGLELYIGTPHCEDSLYAKTPPPDSVDGDKPFLRGASRLTLPILDAMGQSAWPDRFSNAMITAQEKRMGPRSFAAQMLLKPISLGQARLNPDLLIPYTTSLTTSQANGQTRYHIGERPMKRIAAWWDPAFGSHRGDGSVLAIALRDHEGGIWLAHLQRLNTDAFKETEEPATRQCRLIAKAVRDFSLRSITVESNGIGKFLPSILRQTLKKEGLRCAVLEHSSRIPKNRRILQSFDALLAAKKLHIYTPLMAQTSLLTEMRAWRPDLKDAADDHLDAVAGVIGLL